jgi:hypothetical protein
MIPQLHKIISDYYNKLQLKNKEMVCFCFEAYVKDRIPITYDKNGNEIIGQVHTELAVGYNHSGFNLLGMICCNTYTPHFDMPRYIFKQPLYCEVKNTRETFKLMKELDQIVCGSISIETFLKNFICDEFTSTTIHPEGFVQLTEINGMFNYSKIKNPLYYECHKVKDSNLQKLLSLPQSCQHYYPILTKLHQFFDNLNETIISLVVDSSTNLSK